MGVVCDGPVVWINRVARVARVDWVAWMDWVAAHTNIAWTWYVLIGTTICCAVGYATSMLTGDSGAKEDSAQI